MVPYFAQRSLCSSRTLKLALLTSTMICGTSGALAQEKKSTGSGSVEEVIVTAQKRSENLQTVPVSIQALSTAKLEQYNISQFGDYVKYLPSVTFQTLGPGVTNVYMRGVASGGDGNHSGPLPSVGMYLDEMPVTTIQGALDVHIYDVARIESLAGPQSTLYGASSEAGTIRIITNKPELGVTSGAFDVQLNSVSHGDVGYGAEGFINLPLTSNSAIRLVAWDEYDSGYIDNKPGKLTYPVSGVTLNNSAIAKKAYNDVTTYGGRAALKIDLNDSWTITPAIIAQDQKSNGVFGYNPKIGDLAVSHFYPENSHDQFYQAAMTVEGKLRNFDLVYSGGYFQRSVHSLSDYTDYSFFYDTLFGSGAYITNAAGNVINPSQHIIGSSAFTKQSHELRISSPSSDRFRVVGGLFYERQSHKIGQDYVIDGFDPALSVKGWPNTIWLTQQMRVDRDMAAFGEASFDILKNLTVTGGVRVFQARNSLKGFFGYGAGFSSHTGEAACFAKGPFQGAPCINLDKVAEETNATYKGNVTYRIDDAKLIYFTASSGFRPGGINRRGGLPPYVSDMLYNYEVGWKTSWADNQFRWNGAAFWENWNDFQFSFLGPNGLTQIANAGQATIKGFESDITWAVNAHLTLTGAVSYTDGGLTANYCGTLDASGKAVTNCASPQAPTGTKLPTIPDLKGNVTARYDFTFHNQIDAWVQGAAVYVGKRTSDLRVFENSLLGNMPAYTSADFSIGGTKGKSTLELFVKNAFDERGQVYRYAECAASVCASNNAGVGPGGTTYVVPINPRLVGLKYGYKF